MTHLSHLCLQFFVFKFFLPPTFQTDRSDVEQTESLPEGGQHAVIEVPRRRQVGVFGVGRVEAPRRLQRDGVSVREL